MTLSFSLTSTAIISDFLVAIAFFLYKFVPSLLVLDGPLSHGCKVVKQMFRSGRKDR